MEIALKIFITALFISAIGVGIFDDGLEFKISAGIFLFGVAVLVVAMFIVLWKI